MRKIFYVLLLLFSIFLIGCIDTKSNFGKLTNVYIENANGEKLQGEYVDFFRIDESIFNTGNKVVKINSAAPVYNYYLLEIENKSDVIFGFEIKKNNDYNFHSIEINKTLYTKDDFDIKEENGFIYLEKSFNISETSIFQIDSLKMAKDGIVNNASTSSGRAYIRGFCIVISEVTITPSVKELDSLINYSNEYFFSFPYKKLPKEAELKDDLYIVNSYEAIYGFKLINNQYYLSVMTSNLNVNNWFIQSDTSKDKLQEHYLLKTYTKLKEEDNKIYFQKENVIITVSYYENKEVIDYVFVEVMYDESIE